MSNALKKAIQYIAIAAIGAVFIYFVFNGTNFADIYHKMQGANYRYIAAGMLVSLVSHYLRALRAITLYRPLGFTIQTKNSLYAVLVGYMMNYIIPRAGEVSRCAVLAKTNHMPIEKSLGTVVTERLVDLFILLLVMLVIFFGRFDLIYGYISENLGATQNAEKSWFKPALAAIFLMVTGVLWFKRKSLAKSPLFNRLLGVVKGFTEGLLSIKKVQNPILFVVYSVAIWACYILMMYLCLFGMESTSQLTFMDCLVVFAMGTIGVVIPAPGAGAGTYHFAVMQALLWFGVPKEDGIAYATMVHGIQMILLLALGTLASVLVLVQTRSNKIHA